MGVVTVTTNSISLHDSNLLFWTAIIPKVWSLTLNPVVQMRETVSKTSSIAMFECYGWRMHDVDGVDLARCRWRRTPTTAYYDGVRTPSHRLRKHNFGVGFLLFVITGRRNDVTAAWQEILSASEHFSQIHASHLGAQAAWQSAAWVVGRH